MGWVSKGCLGGQAARHYTLPHNYRVRLAQPNTFHQLTLVFGRARGTGNDDFEREGSHKVVWVGRPNLCENTTSKTGWNCCFVALSDGRVVLERWIWNERRARIMAESGVEFVADLLIKYHRAISTICLCDGARRRSPNKRNQPYNMII